MSGPNPKRRACGEGRKKSARLACLPPEQRLRLAQWLTVGVPTAAGMRSTYRDVLPVIEREFGFKVSDSTLSEYFRSTLALTARKGPTAPAPRDRLAGVARGARVFQGRTVEDVATSAALAPEVIRQLEAGIEPSPLTLRAIELALGVEPGWLARTAYED